MEAVGHAGEEPRGSNLLCAAFSTLFEVLVAGANNLPAESVDYVRDEQKNHWKLVAEPDLIPSTDWGAFRHTLKSTASVAGQIVDSNPDRCQLTQLTHKTN